jgi:hypothetical protein
MFSALKYQKKKCLGPTSSQPVNWSTGVSQRVEFCFLMRIEWWGEWTLRKVVKSVEDISAGESISERGDWSDARAPAVIVESQRRGFIFKSRMRRLVPQLLLKLEALKYIYTVDEIKLGARGNSAVLLSRLAA